MPLIHPLKCWRGRGDCVSIASVEGMPEDTTQEQMETLDYEPTSFVCCGCVHEDARKIPQDAYRLCFKNDVSDEMSDNDDQDLAHIAYVIAQTMAVVSSQRVHSGSIEVLGDEGLVRVPTVYEK